MGDDHKVTVRLFGAFRDLGLGDEMECLVRSGSTVKEFREQLTKEMRHRSSREDLPLLISVSVLGSDTEILREEDSILPHGQLALLPPVCGG